MQDVWPVSLLYFPAPHNLQNVLPTSSWYWPRGQATFAPLASANWPAGTGVQSSPEVSPVWVDVRPAGQFWQNDAPAKAYLPALHKVLHNVWPVWPLYFPASHNLQKVLPDSFQGDQKIINTGYKFSDNPNCSELFVEAINTDD